MIDLDEDTGVRRVSFDLRDISLVHIDAVSRLHVDSHWHLKPEDLKGAAYHALVNQDRQKWREVFHQVADRHDPRERLKGAFARNTLAGFSWYGPCQTFEFRKEEIGELHALYVHPEYQRRGIAMRLFADAAAGLKLAGYDRMMISTYRDAQDANGFYRAIGCTLDTGNVYALRPGARDRVTYHFEMGESL